jgi:hypothetical protein
MAAMPTRKLMKWDVVRLYRLRFFNINQPELGGTVDMLLDGTEPAADDGQPRC